MKFLPLFLCLSISTLTFAGETGEKIKSGIQNTAEKIDAGTRKLIKKSKSQLKQRQEARRKKKKMQKDKKKIHSEKTSN